MTSDSTESPEVQGNRILGEAIGLSHHEVAEFVTNIEKKDEGGQYRIHLSFQIQSQANSM